MTSPSSRVPRGVRRVGWAVMGVIVLVVLVLGWTTPDPGRVSPERRYALAAQLRCVQCTGESVAGSQAASAVEMRAEIDRQMEKGQTDDEIVTYFVDRYGESILLIPSSGGWGTLAWVLPPVAAGLGLSAVVLALRRSGRNRSAPPVEVSDQDRALVERALVERALVDRALVGGPVEGVPVEGEPGVSSGEGVGGGGDPGA